MSDEARVLLTLGSLAATFVAARYSIKRFPTQWDRMEAFLGRLFFISIGLGIGAFLLYAFVIAPSRVMDDDMLRLPHSKRADDRAKAHAVSAIVDAFGGRHSRVQLFGDGNLVVFLERERFEDTPFPDREAQVRDSAKSWCIAANGALLPTVALRDIRTGDELASYSCTTDQVSLSSSP